VTSFVVDVHHAREFGQVVDAAFEITGATMNLVDSFLTHWAWPLAAVVIAIVLRRQIAELARGLGARISKVSIMSVKIELAAAREAPSPWTLYPGADVRGLTDSGDLISGADTLLSALAEPDPVDFMIVDLGRGKEWLTTRLFLFATLMELTRKVRQEATVSCARKTNKWARLSRRLPTAVYSVL